MSEVVFGLQASLRAKMKAAAKRNAEKNPNSPLAKKNKTIHPSEAAPQPPPAPPTATNDEDADMAALFGFVKEQDEVEKAQSAKLEEEAKEKERGKEEVRPNEERRTAVAKRQYHSAHNYTNILPLVSQLYKAAEEGPDMEQIAGEARVSRMILLAAGKKGDNEVGAPLSETKNMAAEDNEEGEEEVRAGAKRQHTAYQKYLAHRHASRAYRPPT